MDGTSHPREKRVSAPQPPASPGEHRHELQWLSERVAQLGRENAELEAFAAVAAHELLEPLIMAESYAAIVAERLGGDEHVSSRRDLDALSRGAARTRLLVETLLHDARSRDGQLQGRRVSVDAIVQESVALLRPQIDARGVRVDLATLPDVWGDEALLSGVFRNLIVNAVKHGAENGAIRIGAEQDGEHWRFSVESRGRTLAPEDREGLFEPFGTPPGKRRARSHGHGLGLAICRRIVERHGGTIGVTAADGSGDGNIFHFTLPRYQL
jgi:signal transduction histidine kinase